MASTVFGFTSNLNSSNMVSFLVTFLVSCVQWCLMSSVQWQMVWLGDEAIRSLGLPGELGHSDKVLPHTKKTYTKTNTNRKTKTNTRTYEAWDSLGISWRQKYTKEQRQIQGHQTKRLPRGTRYTSIMSLWPTQQNIVNRWFKKTTTKKKILIIPREGGVGGADVL